MSETVLWTNPSPTSSFTSQDISLSQSIDDFDEVVIYFRLSTTDNTESFVKYSVEEFKKFRESTNAVGTITSRAGATSAVWVRAIFYYGSTTVHFAHSWQTGNNSAINSNTIPTKIVGLK